MAKQYGREITGFTDAACEQMMAHPWNGNVRELQHAVEKAVILADGDKIQTIVVTSASNARKEMLNGDAQKLESMERMMIAGTISDCCDNLS